MTTATSSKPTERTYTSLSQAYDYFNAELFGGQLPPCLITMQRHRGAYGYFSGKRFASLDNASDYTDEIALNPLHFKERTLEQTISTLVHEMAHLWQEHFGDPPRTCYHDKEWAAKMREIGLVPSHTGLPGGKQTGQKMTHYIDPQGAYARAFRAFTERASIALYGDVANELGDSIRKKKAASKTKYSCPQCGLNAWAKPDILLVCGTCRVDMEDASND